MKSALCFVCCLYHSKSEKAVYIKNTGNMSDIRLSYKMEWLCFTTRNFCSILTVNKVLKEKKGKADMYRMLVVDDEKTERECVRFLIEQSGLPLEVSEAGDGWEALMRLKETDGADILFTDVQMPLMDGLELIREAEKLFPDMKILIFSSYADLNMRARR